MSKPIVKWAFLAVILAGCAIWVHIEQLSSADVLPPQLAASELAELQPGAEADVRLMGELIRQVGYAPGAWKDLPPTAIAVYVTLWAESFARNGSWSQLAEQDPAEVNAPSLADIAAGYDELGLSATAADVRTLERQFDAARKAFRAWYLAVTSGTPQPRPSSTAIDAAAQQAFRGLPTIQAQRLKFIRDHVTDLNIR
jgi:hypothetical protein